MFQRSVLTIQEPISRTFLNFLTAAIIKDTRDEFVSALKGHIMYFPSKFTLAWGRWCSYTLHPKPDCIILHLDTSGVCFVRKGDKSWCFWWWEMGGGKIQEQVKPFFRTLLTYAFPGQDCQKCHSLPWLGSCLCFSDPLVRWGPPFMEQLS